MLSIRFPMPCSFVPGGILKRVHIIEGRGSESFLCLGDQGNDGLHYIFGRYFHSYQLQDKLLMFLLRICHLICDRYLHSKQLDFLARNYHALRVKHSIKPSFESETGFDVSRAKTAHTEIESAKAKQAMCHSGPPVGGTCQRLIWHPGYKARRPTA